jgi:hypothetical protein
MQINVTYDSSVDDAPAAFKVDVQCAVSVLDGMFSNNVTLNIHVGWGEVGGLALQPTDLGESETAVAPKYTYSQIVGALQQAAGQPNASPDLVAAAQTLVGLPDPTDGGPFDIGLAEAQALGLAPNNPTANDGWVGFAANASEWSFSTTATPASNKYYLVGTILHEITEVMGRDSDIGKAGDHYSDAWGVPDLFRFSGAGQRSDSPGPGHSTAYFSIDNGTTVPRYLEQPCRQRFWRLGFARKPGRRRRDGPWRQRLLQRLQQFGRPQSNHEYRSHLDAHIGLDSIGAGQLRAQGRDVLCPGRSG